MTDLIIVVEVREKLIVERHAEAEGECVCVCVRKRETRKRSKALAERVCLEMCVRARVYV